MRLSDLLQTIPVSYTHLRLVDGDAKRRQSVQVHQQVVDHIFHLATIKGAQDITQCHSILPTQGMVGHKSIKPVSYTHLPYLAIGLFGKAKAEGDILAEYEFDDNSTNVFGDDAMKRDVYKRQPVY